MCCEGVKIILEDRILPFKLGKVFDESFIVGEESAVLFPKILFPQRNAIDGLSDDIFRFRAVFAILPMAHYVCAAFTFLHTFILSNI